MKFNDFNILTEAGISKSYLLKYGGKYLDMLINMIATNKDVELEGDAKKKHGKTVKFDPSEAERLSQLFYGEDAPVEEKENVNVDDRGYLIPAKSLPSKISVKIKGSDQYVPTGQIFKTPEMKGSKKPFNTGDVGEAFLGAACTAKFEKLGEEITEKDVVDVLKRMTVTEEGKNKRGVVNSKVKNDTLNYVLVLNQTSFGAMYRSINEGKLPAEMIGLNRSAVAWANKSEAVKEAVKVAIGDPEQNTIVINSDGVSDQKGTKADLFLTIDEKTLNLLSAKAGDVKQFGQVPGNSYEKIEKFFKSIFGVDIKDSYIEEMNGEDAQHNYPIFKKIYADVADELENELKGNTKKEVKFIERLYNGISYHASLNDPKVSMVILKATPNSPGFTELSFGPELRAAMDQFDLQVSYQADPPKIQVHGRPIGTEALQELSGATMLIQARTNMKSDSARGYIRSIIEMGGLLKAIAKVEDKIEDKQQEPEQPKQAQPKQAQPKQAQPTAQPTAQQEPQVKQTNDPNAKVEEALMKPNEEFGPNYDIVDDLHIYMRNNPDVYRKNYFPMLCNMQKTIQSGKKISVKELMMPCIRECGNSYNRQYGLAETFEELMTLEQARELARKIYDEEMPLIKKGVYR
jgi:hypothetical protein